LGGEYGRGMETTMEEKGIEGEEKRVEWNLGRGTVCNICFRG